MADTAHPRGNTKKKFGDQICERIWVVGSNRGNRLIRLTRARGMLAKACTALNDMPLDANAFQLRPQVAFSKIPVEVS